jgi:hypothetical protein
MYTITHTHAQMSSLLNQSANAEISLTSRIASLLEARAAAVAFIQTTQLHSVVNSNRRSIDALDVQLKQARKELDVAQYNYYYATKQLAILNN